MNDNGGSQPASPFTNKPEYQHQDTGLTKREIMAMHAMQALLSNQGVTDIHYDPERVANEAATAADALLKELNK